MRRREFIRGIAGSAAAWPLAARAQQSATPVIGFISSRSQKESTTVVDAFRQGLRDLGYVEGQNVEVEYQWADGQLDRLPTIAAHLVNRRVAVIVAAGGDRPALAAKAATSTIPIIFTGSDLPVKVGLVDSLNRPGGNVTGASLFTSELETKKFALLRELMPKASLIAILVNPSNPSAESDVQDVQSAAASVGQRISLLKASSEREIDAAFEAVVAERADALLVAHDPIFLSRREQFVALAARHGTPAIYEFREFVLIGGLMSYGSRITENYQLAGKYAGRILKRALASAWRCGCEDAETGPPSPSASSDKIHNALDVFEDLLFRFIAFGGLHRQPSAAGRKQVFKGVADQRIGIKVSGDHTKSSAITIRRRLIVAANGVAHAHEQGL